MFGNEQRPYDITTKSESKTPVTEVFFLNDTHLKPHLHRVPDI